MRDQSLRNKINSYKSDYPTSTWTNVKARLEQKKKKRLLFFFLLLFSLICATMGFYKMISTQPEAVTPTKAPSSIIS